MTGLRLSTIADDRPVKMMAELPAALHCDLVAYAKVLAELNGEAAPPEPAKLVAPMVQRFMAGRQGLPKSQAFWKASKRGKGPTR